MKKIYLVFNFLFLFSISVLGNDDYFQFIEQSLPEKIEYETSRKLCLFPFRNKIGNENFQYLSNGIPSVIISNLNGFKYVYDPEVLENVIYHAYGDPNKIPPEKKGKTILNRNEISKLNSGSKEVLPEQDPRYIKLEVSLIQMEDSPLLEANLEIGRKNKCFYVITGEYITNENDSLSINLEFTFRKNGKIVKITESTSLKRAYQEMNALGLKIKKMIFNKELATVQIETGENSDALVFIDGHYAGKTPLEKSDIASGKHSVSITKDGFQSLNRVINIKKESISKYIFELKKIEKQGLLTVTSNPPGAVVYLGSTYLGETPLSNAVVPLGQNRIRIEKEDHIDHYSGVDIELGKTFTVNAKLKQGKTEDFYKYRLNVFLDYTYFDFSQYSVYSAVLFYASMQYWNYRINEQRDSIRGIVFNSNGTNTVQGQIISNLEFLTIYQSNFADGSNASNVNFYYFLLNQRRIVKKNEERATEYTNYRNASAIAGVSMIILAGVYYYLGVDNEAFEFAIIPPMRNQANPFSSQGFESYAKFNFRF